MYLNASNEMSHFLKSIMCTIVCVCVEAVVWANPGLTIEALGRRHELRGGAVVPEERSDLELHSFVEEEVAVVPELGRNELPELIDVLEGDDISLGEGRGRAASVLLRSCRACGQR